MNEGLRNTRQRTVHTHASRVIARPLERLEVSGVLNASLVRNHLLVGHGGGVHDTCATIGRQTSCEVSSWFSCLGVIVSSFSSSQSRAHVSTCSPLKISNRVTITPRRQKNTTARRRPATGARGRPSSPTRSREIPRRKRIARRGGSHPPSSFFLTLLRVTSVPWPTVHLVMPIAPRVVVGRIRGVPLQRVVPVRPGVTASHRGGVGGRGVRGRRGLRVRGRRRHAVMEGRVRRRHRGLPPVVHHPRPPTVRAGARKRWVGRSPAIARSAGNMALRHRRRRAGHGIPVAVHHREPEGCRERGRHQVGVGRHQGLLPRQALVPRPDQRGMGRLVVHLVMHLLIAGNLRRVGSLEHGAVALAADVRL